MTNAPPPRVSVVMAVHNGARYLDESIDSILTQDFRDLEFIIVDDASRDQTPAMIRAWQERDSRIVSFTLESNRGVSAALNAGIEKARGGYIARQDHDDVSLPGRLRAEVEILDRDPGVVLVSTNLLLIDSEGKTIGSIRRALPSEAIAYLLNFSNFVAGGGQVMYRRHAAVEAGGYRFHVSEDYDLWTRLADRGRIVILPMYGMRYRVHPASLSRVSVPVSIELSNEIARRTLTRLLGREVSEGEAVAIAHVWNGVVDRNLLPTAERIMREAFGILGASRTSREVRWAVRQENARRIAIAGMLLSWREGMGELPLHVALSLRWHPLGWIAGLRFAWDRAVDHVRIWARRGKVSS